MSPLRSCLGSKARGNTSEMSQVPKSVLEQAEESAKVNIGIIADGNGRWAESRGLPRVRGHEAGAENIKGIIACLKGKADYLTLYGFSTENWNRSREEVNHLFRIMEEHVNGVLLEWCIENGIRLYHFGSRDRLPEGLLNAMDRARMLTSRNRKMHVGFCLDYGAREEIENAARLYDGNLRFQDYLYTYSFPDVDLIIRTGGEHRLSNFLLYQSAYAEIYFTDTLFPDLGEKELMRILDWFKSRRRTFGG